MDTMVQDFWRSTGTTTANRTGTHPILEIRLFSDLGVQTAFGPFPACLWHGERSRALLCYLAYRSTTATGMHVQRPGHAEDDLVVVPRDDILHALWPDQELRFAQAALHKSAYLMRQALQSALGPMGRDLLISRPTGYALCSRSITVDVAQFKQAVFAGRWAARMEQWADAQQAFSKAVEIYSDDLLLEDYNSAWAGVARAQLRQTFGEVVRMLAGLASDAGEHDKAETWWKQVLAIDPTDAVACCHLMQLSLGAGRCGAALRIFRQYQQQQAQRGQHGLDPMLVKLAVQAIAPPRPTAAIAVS